MRFLMIRWFSIVLFLVAASIPGIAGGITYSFSPISPPGAYRTIPTGINDAGQVVGYSSPVGAPASVGFLYSAGTYTQILFPGSYSTDYLSINNLGLVVGDWYSSPGTSLSASAFSYLRGIYTSLNIPLPSTATSVTVGAVNNLDEIAGTYFLSGQTYVFKYGLSSGNLISVVLPGNYPQVEGINDLGEIVGHYQPGTSSTLVDAFLISNGIVSTYDSPLQGAVRTEFTGINNSGLISGFVFGPDESFILDGNQPISNQNPINTNTDGYGYTGINSEDDVVAYAFDTANDNGYIGTPTPEPAAMGMFLIGITTAALFTRFRKLPRK